MAVQHLTYKFKILPNSQQEESLCRILKECCDIHNGFLQYIGDTWNASGDWKIFEDNPDHCRLWYHHGERLDKEDYKYNYNKISKLLTDLRNELEHGPEWSKTSRAIQQDVIRKLDRSMKEFFKGLKEDEATKGYPKFKSLRKYKTFEIGMQKNPQTHKLIYSSNRKWAFVTFKGIPGKLRIFLHRKFPEEFEFKNARITKFYQGNWKIQFILATNIPEITEDLKYIGIDLGIKSFAIYDDGEVIDNPEYFKESKKEIQRLDRSVSSKVRGSGNRSKAVQARHKGHRKVADQRKDFHHKAANEIIAKAIARGKGIAVEELRISNMIRNRKLSAKIADAGWRDFLNILEYKAAIAGISFKKVSAQNTSQLCSQCGTMVPKKLKIRIHNCHNCGLVMDRDQNAAINISKRAQKIAESNLQENETGVCLGIQEHNIQDSENFLDLGETLAKVPCGITNAI